MPALISRREFGRITALAGTGILGGLGVAEALGHAPTAPSELYALSNRLAQQWLTALLQLQITDQARGADYGGIRGPGDAAVPGRIAETIYPLLHRARHTRQSRYLDAAHLLYRWAETNVSQPDGSWLNEPQPGAWKGTTVFMAIALAEALKNHGTVLDLQFKTALSGRLLRAGNFIHDTFTIDYGNINYPITASYGLALLGEVLDVPRFRQKGHELAHQALRFFSPTNHLLFGEGTPYYETSKKGCYPIDLGYNVEESLPSLVHYGLLTKDEEVLAAVTRALQAHLEFMLPDGGWDNSWGTRNYKWTYWGSRTSDGCQPAFALLAARDPRFYKAALRNAQLLEQCTAAGLLTGGPHAAAHGVPTSVHHTFCHLKALTTILDHGDAYARIDVSKAILPREQAYGSRFFADINTWLVAQGSFRATVTGYDREYKATHNGHASGGALTLLWHPKTGPLLAASMTDYQRYEAGNMPPDTTPSALGLTPRIELVVNGISYRNISDLNAEIQVRTGPGICTVTARAQLVDEHQQSPAAGAIPCQVVYIFAENKVTLTFTVAAGAPDQNPGVILPLISRATEKVTVISDRQLSVAKASATVTITANQPLVTLPAGSGRAFNFVPGLEALPLSIAGIAGHEVVIELAIS
ncbi:hypothetical protein [Hymenobacter terricola]|uniref:hypothetical protein n=1 Tax=Hymenobacter terricola TaxID=2819236 RepID=UPI001B305772|nr:hypothetical protein [Hymenobacter terricola]